MRTVRTSAGVALLVAAVAAGSASAAQTGGSVTVSARHVAIGHSLTVYGSHLRSHHYYAVMVAVPNARRPVFSRFIGSAKSDGNGSLRLTARVPNVTPCGPGGVYLLRPGTASIVGTPVQITGCRAKTKKPLVPPAPPAPPHKSKHKKP